MAYRVILLDTTPLGLLTHPRPSAAAVACRQWLQTHVGRGARIIVPEIADYELRRFLIISPNASYARYRYPGTSRVDDRAGAGVSATYLVNRTIGLTAAYSYLQQTSSGGFGGYDFDDNRFSLTLTLQR